MSPGSAARDGHRVASVFLAAAAAVATALVVHGTGLSWSVLLRTTAGAALLSLPIGDLLLPRAREALRPGERLALAAGVGYPAGAALHYACARLRVDGHAWIVCAILAMVALARRWRWWRRAPEAERAGPAWGAPTALALLVPVLLWLLMRDATVFVPVPQGLLYDWSIDYPYHMAYYWELLRGVPPRQIPMLAGLPEGSYHVLGFMPGLFLVRQTGLDVIALEHVVSPALRLLLLMGGVWVAVRLSTGNAVVALAALVSVFPVSLALGNLLEGRVVDAAAPFSFFLASESGGAAIVVWTTVAALLALRERAAPADRARVLMLASAVAGLAYGFKAQTFLLMAPAYGAALVLLWRRDRDRSLLAALAVTAGAAAAVILSWRAPLVRGVPLFTPGRFAEVYVRPALTGARLGAPGAWISAGLDRLPAGLGDVLATGLGVWRMAGLSVFVIAWLVHAARHWRTRGLLESTLALAVFWALPLGYAFSVRAIDGVVSPYEFIQAAQGLGFLAGAVNAIALFALLGRLTARPAEWTLGLALAAATAIVPTLLSGRTLSTPHRDALISPDEACALLFLRDRTPLDAVVVTARGDGVPPGSRRLNYHPLVSGMAGRRSVLEYFWREVDTSVDRVRAVRRLFDTPDPAEGEAILRRFGVTHVLEFGGRPLRFSSPDLAEAYRHGSVTVYRFGPERPGVAPPAGMDPAFGLTCDAAHSSTAIPRSWYRRAHSDSRAAVDSGYVLGE
jgi:hypothetical protein